VPVRPGKVCSHPGCNTLTTAKHGKCKVHRKAHNWEDDKIRGTRTDRGYGWKWEKIRERIIERDSGMCQVCFRPGNQVDHIIPKAKGGTDEPENLRCICKSCHATKTQRDSQ